MKKKIMAALLCGAMMCSLSACRESERVAYNISKEADNFNITRRLEVINARTDKPVFELIGKPDKIDAFLKMFTDYKILEQCRTGVTALERGGMHQHMQKPPQQVRSAQLPLPGTHCPERT